MPSTATSGIALAGALTALACGEHGGGGDGPAADAADAPGWTRLADVDGGAIQETAVAALDGVVYVVGGIDDAGRTTSAVRAFDVASGAWAAAPPALPVAVHHANLAATDGSLFVLGALAPSFAELAVAWRWTPGDPAWTAIAPPPETSARGAAAVGVIDGIVYLAGGLRGGASVADTSAYDPATDAWSELPPLPAARDHLTGQAAAGVLLAIGGRSGGIGGVTDRVDAFDPRAGEWSARAPLPTARAGMASGVVDGEIVVVGGEGNPGAATGVFAEVEAYDPAADAWRELAPMPTPRHGMGAAGVDDVLYVPGGATVQGFGAVALHESFAP